MPCRILIPLSVALAFAACTRMEAPAETFVDAPSAPTMPGPNRGRLDAAVRTNESCLVCHDEQAAEWRGSLHRRSSVDPAYRRALALEPSAFCRGCHAPEANPQYDLADSVSEMGVGCVTCHVTEEGLVLAAPKNEESSAPHPVRRSPEFANTGACVNCHEFTFPGIGLGSHDDGMFMQTTVREHDRSRGNNQSCADCHMPVVQGHKSHSFAQVRDPEWLRKSLEVNAKRGDFQELVVTLRQTNSGHAFPTGDLFRRLEVGAVLRDVRGRKVRRDERYLARHFIERRGASGRYLESDDRIFDSVVLLDLDVAPPQSAQGPFHGSYWVKLQRVATVGEGSRANEAVVESEVVLAEGDFLW
jgi:hypothetical protein